MANVVWTPSGLQASRNTFLNVPGGAQLWHRRDTNQWYIIYNIPQATGGTHAGTGRRITGMAYRIPGADLSSLTEGAPRADRSFANLQAMKNAGAVMFGTSDRLQGNAEHPFRAFSQDYAAEVRLRPWLKDQEVLAYAARAILEGRSEIPESWLRQTQWWQTRTEGEREWARLLSSDRATAMQRRDDNRRKVFNELQSMGMPGLNQQYANVLADNLTSGRWSEEQLREHMWRAVDPWAPGASPLAGRTAPPGSQAVRGPDGKLYLRHNGRDYELRGAERELFGAGARNVSSVNPAGLARNLIAAQPIAESVRHGEGTAEIRELVNRIVGPYFAKTMGENEMAIWASRIRRNPGARDTLIERLRQNRLALFPEWDDPMLEYQDIAPVARAAFSRIWRQDAPNEEAPVFIDVLRQSKGDMAKAEWILREEGFKRNIKAVTDAALTGLMGAGINQERPMMRGEV